MLDHEEWETDENEAELQKSESIFDGFSENELGQQARPTVQRLSYEEGGGICETVIRRIDDYIHRDNHPIFTKH